MVMVVVTQSDALSGQLGLELVEHINERVELGLGGQIRAGDDDAGVADGLVVGDGLLKVLGDLVPAGVGAGNLQAVVVQQLLDLFCRNAEEACELDVLVSHFGQRPERAGHILFGDVAHAVHLNAVFSHGFLLHFLSKRAGAGPSLL